jgi:hypothetical protein
MAKKLIASNFHPNTTEQDLVDMFEEYGLESQLQLRWRLLGVSRATRATTLQGVVGGMVESQNTGRLGD